MAATFHTRSLAAEGHKVSLVLLDGPVGGPRGAFEEAILGQVASDSGEIEVGRQLVDLLVRGGEESPEPRSCRAQLDAFVASNDAVGLEVAREHFSFASVHRVHGGHREILRAGAAAEVADIIARAWVLGEHEVDAGAR